MHAARFDRATLESMTVRQLRRLARDHYGDCLGGCLTKESIVGEILSQQDARAVAGAVSGGGDTVGRG